MLKNSTTSCEAPDLPDEDKWSHRMKIQGQAAKQMTTIMLNLMGDCDNYIEFMMEHPKHGHITLTLQRNESGKITPGVKADQLKKRVKKLEEKLREAGIGPDSD